MILRLLSFLSFLSILSGCASPAVLRSYECAVAPAAANRSGCYCVPKEPTSSICVVVEK